MGLTRAERRRRSGKRILIAARTLFAELGYERTTIRAVAAAAGVDPSLVIQHFGSKQDLFAHAVKAPDLPESAATPDEIVEHIIGTLGLKLGDLPPQTLAMMRSMLTHPEAARTVRDSLGRWIGAVGNALPGEDPQVRAALLMTTMVGVIIGQRLLELDALRDVPPDRLVTLLRPCFAALVDGK